MKVFLRQLSVSLLSPHVTGVRRCYAIRHTCTISLTNLKGHVIALMYQSFCNGDTMDCKHHHYETPQHEVTSHLNA